MQRYIILLNPGHNSVYYKQSVRMAEAELGIACMRSESGMNPGGIEEIAGIKYISFVCPGSLSEEDLEVVSRLSFAQAIFKIMETEGETYLLPVKKAAEDYLDRSISSILKYSGKTNYLFTRMMINVALLSSEFTYEDNISLLDPVAGKGTTLFEGLAQGFDAAGIEIMKRAAAETDVFMKKFLETERIKHLRMKNRLQTGNPKLTAPAYHFEFATDKDDFKKGNRKHLTLVQGNTKHTDMYFKKKQFHLIVGDLPYGIFHGSRSKDQGENLTRNPTALLEGSLGAWKNVLKTGGTIVLAYNKFLISAEKLQDIFTGHGFSVLKGGPYDDFEHRVDSSIKRDIIVAVK